MLIVHETQEWKKNCRPSAAEIERYGDMPQPCAVFEKDNGSGGRPSYTLCYLGLDDPCDPELAELFGKSYEKAAALANRTTTPSRVNLSEEENRSRKIEWMLHADGSGSETAEVKKELIQPIQNTESNDG